MANAQLNKIPKVVYFIMVFAIILIAILCYGFYYERYLKPVDCKTYSPDYCPARCAVCPTCKTCSAIACQEIQTCKDLGMYESWFEQIRTKQGQLTPGDEIKQTYEPALMQLPGYDHFEIIECDESLCVKVFFKNGGEKSVDKLPQTMANMRVIGEIIKPAGDNGSVAAGCGIENCHGLDIVCGPNVPSVCTEIYMLGDGCRRFAKCEIIDGKCRQVPIGDFDECKACVKKCSSDYALENAKMFQCESVCVNK